MVDLPPHDVTCIAQAIYAEAGAESEKGKRAVGHVIINRTKNGRFARTPCAVIKQKNQFKFRTGSGPNWKASLQAARNLGIDPTKGALYFKAKYSRARWPYTLVATIGNHLFYK